MSRSTPTSTRSASCSGKRFSFLSVPESRLGGINNRARSLAGGFSDANFISYSFLTPGGSLIPSTLPVR